MSTPRLSEYIGQRYDRWMDYIRYQANRAGIPEDSEDILHTVILSLLEKDPREIDRLLSRRKRSYSHADQVYTELDFYVLRMLQLNAHSPTSPWRFKNKMPPLDENISFSPSNFGFRDPEEEDPEQYLEEAEYEDPDQESEKDPMEFQLERWRKLREVLEDLNLSDRDKELFTWKVFADNPLSAWPGREDYTTVCNKFNEVKELVTYSACMHNNDQVTRLALRLLKAVIHERNEELRNKDLRIRKFTKVFLSVRPVLQGVA